MKVGREHCNDSASERPASPDVEAALIEEPLDNSNDVRLSVVMLAILIQSGRFFIMFLTLRTKLPAVSNLVAITRMALSR